MENLVSILHITTAVVALVTAAIVLLFPKGTLFHKRMGYVFALSLLGVNLSAAFMYNLTGTVNFLHFFILLSMASLVYGMWAAIRRTDENWLTAHIKGMNGAALGVWAAGFAELTVRVLPIYLSPHTIIWTAIGIGVVFFFLIGYANYIHLNQIEE